MMVGVAVASAVAVVMVAVASAVAVCCLWGASGVAVVLMAVTFWSHRSLELFCFSSPARPAKRLMASKTDAKSWSKGRGWG